MINSDVDFRNQLGGNVAYVYELYAIQGQDTAMNTILLKTF